MDDMSSTMIEEPETEGDEGAGKIRGFRCPDPLWEAAKAKARRRSRPGRRETLTDVLVRAVEDYVNAPEDQ